MSRLRDLRQFYEFLNTLERHAGGKRLLSQCTAELNWPCRGVYFFFEPGEERGDSGTGPRIVRVGTHAVSAAADSTLWSRLRAHRGDAGGGGNHRASVFRKLVGEALLCQTPALVAPTWGHGSSRSNGNPALELAVEQAVTRLLGRMSLVCLSVEDAPSATSQRSMVERNAIGLLSNYGRPPLDGPSDQWLGRSCPRPKIQMSGLWNSDFVGEQYESSFLHQMEHLVLQQMEGTDSSRVLLAHVKESTRAGDEIYTVSQRRRNVITGVDNHGIMVLTDRGTSPQHVPWAWVEEALEALVRQRSLAQDEIPGRGRYRSAFILALLAAKLPHRVRVTDGRLVLRS